MISLDEATIAARRDLRVPITARIRNTGAKWTIAAVRRTEAPASMAVTATAVQTNTPPVSVPRPLTVQTSNLVLPWMPYLQGPA